MPELPEVETVVRTLAPQVVGAKIFSVRFNREKKLRVPYPIIDLCGKTITNISRRAKFILIHLDNAQYFVCHLGMTGRLLYFADYQEAMHQHMVMQLDNSGYILYRDPRRFGLLDVLDMKEQPMHPWFINLGPEPLSHEWTVDEFTRACRMSKTTIKATIMKQNIVVGVGNIYAAEALFQSGINPHANTTNISDASYEKLHYHIVAILQAALKSGGSTLRDYANAHNQSGSFQMQLQVYGRAKQPCYQCGNKIMVDIIAGRSSYYCGKCQLL